MLALQVAAQARDQRLAGGVLALGRSLQLGPDGVVEFAENFRQRDGVLVGLDEEFVVVHAAQRGWIEDHRECGGLDAHDFLVHRPGGVLH